MNPVSSRKALPQATHGWRWNEPSRIARRKSARRSALTLFTASNALIAPQAGQASSVLSKMDIDFSSGGFRLVAQHGQPGGRRVLRLQLVEVERRVQLGEPLGRRAELVGADAPGPRREVVAHPIVLVGLLDDSA